MKANKSLNSNVIVFTLLHWNVLLLTKFLFNCNLFSNETFNIYSYNASQEYLK